MAEFTLGQQIKAVEREIDHRMKDYPRLVSVNKMTQEQANTEISVMRSVQRTLLWVQKNRAVFLKALTEQKTAAETPIEVSPDHGQGGP